MSWKRKIFEALLSPYVNAFHNAKRWNVSLFEKSEPVFRQRLADGDLLFACPSRFVLWRAETLLTKEPETIAWIDSFQKGETLFDIGANVGLYSLYAALRGITCVAFEPESQNYALLNRNIYLNSFGAKITALNMAVNSTSSIGFLNLKDFLPGSALNNFGAAVDYQKNAFKPAFKQGVISVSLDDLVSRYGLEVPTHIKIDVDGIERDVIAGAMATLANPKVKSVQIELNIALKEDLEIKAILENSGFSCVNRHHAPRFDEGSFKQLYNFTFRRLAE